MKYIIILLISAYLVPLFGEDSLTLKEEVKTDSKAKEGWTAKLKLSNNISLSSSKKVVGQVDGESNTFGIKIESFINYKKDQSEWRQALNYSGTTTRTSILPRYVKSADELIYNNIYLHSLKNHKNLGPYARLNVKTSVFKGEDVQVEELTYINTTTGANLGTHKVFPMTSPFTPLTTSESVGLFYKAITEENRKLEFRLGLGATQTNTKSQYILDDDADTKTIIEIKEMEDVTQEGVEYGFLFKGKWNKQSSYTFSADLLTPFKSQIAPGKVCDDCSTEELTNIDLVAKLSTKLNEWISITYEYQALKQPQILDAFQIKHGFVLNVFYDVL